MGNRLSSSKLNRTTSARTFRKPDKPHSLNGASSRVSTLSSRVRSPNPPPLSSDRDFLLSRYVGFFCLIAKDYKSFEARKSLS